MEPVSRNDISSELVQTWYQSIIWMFGDPCWKNHDLCNIISNAMMHNNHFRQWLVTQLVLRHNLRKPIVFHEYHRHELHIKYISFQVLCVINDRKAGIHTGLNLVMMLCYCKHNSMNRYNHRYIIPGCDALYNLKKQGYYEFLPFQVYRQGMYISVRGCDVARSYMHMFEFEIPTFDCVFWLPCHTNCYHIGTYAANSSVMYC